MAANRARLPWSEFTVSARVSGTRHAARWPSPKKSIVALLLLACSIGPIRPASAQVDAKPAQKWFDSLGYPDLAKTKLVRVATGHSYGYGGGPPIKSFVTAFLVKTEGESFI